MKNISPQEKEKLLAKVFWDQHVETEQLNELLSGKIKSAGPVKSTDLFYRLLTTFDWYTLMKIVPRERLSYLLSDSVINRIKSDDLQERFRYARRFLSK